MAEQKPFQKGPYIGAVLAVVLTTLISAGLFQLFAAWGRTDAAGTNLAMVYLACVVAVSLFWGRGPVGFGHLAFRGHLRFVLYPTVWNVRSHRHELSAHIHGDADHRTGRRCRSPREFTCRTEAIRRKRTSHVGTVLAAQPRIDSTAKSGQRCSSHATNPARGLRR